MKINIYFRSGMKGATIYISYAHAGQPTLKIPTGIVFNPKKPNPIEDSIVETKKVEISKMVSDYWADHGDYPTPSQLKQIIDSKAKIKTVELTKSNVADLYEKWLERQTIRAKQTHKHVIRAIRIVFKNWDLKDTTIENLDKLKNYWIKENINNSTLKKWMQKLKQFLKEQSLTSEKPNPEFASYSLKNLKCIKNDDNIFTLTREEFDILFKYQFKDVNVQYAVNLYLLSCVSGLRIGTVKLVNLESVKVVKGIQRITVPINKSNNEWSIVPLNAFSEDIIYRRNINMKLSEQNIRDNLKKAFIQLVEEKIMPDTFAEEVQYLIMSGAEGKHLYGPKYKFLIFHSSRKFFASFITDLIDKETAMLWGGWHDSRSFDRYSRKDFNEKDKLDLIK